MDNLQTAKTIALLNNAFDRSSSIKSYRESASPPLAATNLSQAIAIVGGGCSGSLVAAQLLRQATTPLTIYLIERSPRLCQGVAYSTQADCHLLNVPAGKMSAFPDDPNHFLDWAQHQKHSLAEILPDGVQTNTFVPRKLYGSYLRSVLDEAQVNAPVDVRLERCQDEVVAIELQPEGTTVRLQSNRILQVQKVVLALGNFPFSHPPVQTPEFYSSSRYIGSAWSARALRGLNSHQSILLIGSSLTMVDLAIALQQQGHQGKIHVVSRHGLLPHRHEVKSSNLRLVKLEPQPLRGLLRQVRQQVRVAADRGQDWRTVVDALRPATQELWQALSLREQRQFLRHLRAYWDIHRHRLAPHVADGIDAILHSGQLVVHAGRIQAYHEDSSGVDVTIRQRHALENITLRVSRVVNCTGPASNYRKLQHPLVVNLRSLGLLCPDELALGIKTAPNGALLNDLEEASKYLYTLGSTRKGELWESVAVPEIRTQAMNLAQEILSQLEVEANLYLERIASYLAWHI
ncbi:MAG: hypothetical protein CLLPBCKN_006052 [Chroococcidiopsis cubana SAG 39.79]|uniref:FAD-dependent urate hydroxylase HpyO/Asp monooxygenase CreE-like FAD/NAD(P)-binding domain-containing protein n=1 Tax=Chroococcidiopsis cubana SAG 39.79 TaxID=388085 RepID=A0AB37U8Q7_9CYAN|nr:FAD/NAD(P)-binding protein [Chroococcidiopsis cubana]MDZ4876617.1 hypothetical protein [Chroococcidiopsis cubana SAG 39.79]PSB62901.1 oxidoreductase [Chroococcidiopsis cubana CCALA 043]RUT00511.1 hypothetical protein DSM107010_67560 [Chroococcidiopsis cubana SAG 39.79]